MELSATLDLSQVDRGFKGMVGRTDRSDPFFRELIPFTRDELKDHKKQRRGPQGKWPARSQESRDRAKRKSKTKRRRSRTGGLLGKLPTNYKTFVSPDHLRMVNRSSWAGAHNAGARIGNGATLPPREFAYLTTQYRESVARQYAAWVVKGYIR